MIGDQTVHLVVKPSSQTFKLLTSLSPRSWFRSISHPLQRHFSTLKELPFPSWVSRGNLNTLPDLGRLSLPRGSQEKVSQSQFPRSRKRESLMATLRGSVWEPPELTGVSACRVLVGSGCGGRAQSYSRDPAPGRGVRFPTGGGAGGDRGASPLPSGVLLGVALRLGALTPSLRAGGGARLTPSPGARLGGRWVWGGSGAGDGGGRYCGGSGTSGRSPGSAVRWAGECRLDLGRRPHWGQAGLGLVL